LRKSNEITIFAVMKARMPIFLSWLLLLLAACDGGRRQQMEADLERLQAWNVADSMLTNDSLAQSLVDYFDRHGTPNERLLAHYLLGRTYADKGDAPRALDAYYEAIEVADTTAADTDYGLLARAHAQMADLFYGQALYQKQLDELDLTEWSANKSGDTVMAVYAIGAKAPGYERLGKLDSALIANRKAAQLFFEYGHNHYYAICLGTMIPSLIETGNYDEAIRNIEVYERHSGLFDGNGNIEHGREVYYYYKGLCFLYQNNIDSAEYYFRKELREGLDLNNQVAGSRGLYLMYKQLAKSDSMAKYAELCYLLNDSTTKLLESEQTLKVAGMYSYEHSERLAKAQELQAQKALEWIYLLCLVLLLSFTVFYIILARIGRKREKEFLKYKENKRKLIEARLTIRELEQENVDHLQIIKEKAAEIARLSSSVDQYERQNVKRLKAYRDERLRCESVVLRFKQMVLPPFDKPTEYDWTELRLFINKVIPEFYGLLNTDSHQLSDTEYRVCMLTRLHFTPKEISIITGVNLSNVSKIRCRLLKKVFGKNGSSKEFDKILYSIPVSENVDY
jgi:tetratricopeptide (TPR) repeat protein